MRVALGQFYMSPDTVVESKKGAVAISTPVVCVAFRKPAAPDPSYHDSVSVPRSSNRTCPTKASGSPTGFTFGTRQIAATFSIDSCRTPSSPKILSAVKRRLPCVVTLWRRLKKALTRSRT